MSLISVYRPPNGDLMDAWNKLNSVIEDMGRNDIIFICGDLNVDLLNPNGSECQLIDLFLSSAFSPLINLPTRIANSSSKCIDHLWTNSLGSFMSGVIPHEITDHFAVLIFCPIISDRELITIKFHDCSPGIYQILSEN